MDGIFLEGKINVLSDGLRMRDTMTTEFQMCNVEQLMASLTRRTRCVCGRVVGWTVLLSSVPIVFAGALSPANEDVEKIVVC